MSLQSARITLKQHRFEVWASAFAAIVIGIVALWVNSKLLGLIVPRGCLDAWLSSGGAVGPECGDQVNAFGQINEEEAGKVFAAMAILPFAVGLLAGVAVVGRELESRTAQTAWALAGSRRRWFGRQLWPILVVLGLTTAFAAFAASILEATRTTFFSYVFSDFGLYGPLVVARAFAALGLGLFVGAVIGRTLPAFIVGGLLAAALLTGAGLAREAWVGAQPRVVFEQASIEGPTSPDVLIFEQAWRTPDGELIPDFDAMALAAEEATDPYQWLMENGYELVQLGITAETARGWEPLEIIGFVGVGLVLILATLAVVERRRPT